MRCLRALAGKMAAVLVAAAMLIGAVAAATAAPPPIRVLLDGESVDFDTPAELTDGRVLVPVRALLERLRFDLEWDPADQTATARRGQQWVMLKVGSADALVDGAPARLDVPARIRGGRLLVPLRFLVEATGGEVDWDAATRTVILEVSSVRRRLDLKVAKINRDLAPAPLPYAQKAREIGFTLTAPDRRRLAVNGALALAGRLGGDYADSLVLVRWRKDGGPEHQAAFGVLQGQFRGTVQLAEGSGEYAFSLYVPATPTSSRWEQVVSLAVQNENPLPQHGPYFEPSFVQLGLTAELPNEGNLAVNAALPLSGTAPTSLNGRYLWAQTRKEGQTWDTFIPIGDGRFHGEAYLGGGAGTHWVDVWLQEAPGNNRFFRVAEVGVVNTTSAAPERREYLLAGMEARLRVTGPDLPAETRDGVLALAGTIDAAYEGQRVWVRAERAGRWAETFLPVRAGAFAGELALSQGYGPYEVSVWVPKLDQDDYYLKAARFHARSQAVHAVRGIHYTTEGFDRDVQVSDPVSGAIRADQRLSVAGTVRSEAFRDHPYLLARVHRDKLEADYRLPVEQGRFAGDVWLRFGPGEYQVSLYAPISGREAVEVARFQATNTGAEDQRYLAPSAGVESDHPEIAALVRQLTAPHADPLAQARAIFTWVAKEVRYDYPKAAEWRVDPDEGALRTLRTRSGICRDYARLAAALARAAGLPARLVVGKAGAANSPFGVTEHAWLEVRVGNRWVEMDPTFAAGAVDGTTFIPRYDPVYFDPPPAFLARDHTREGILY